jgi:hypothetical protein
MIRCGDTDIIRENIEKIKFSILLKEDDDDDVKMIF